MKRHDKPSLKSYRKELRKNLPPAEAFLWKHLQNRKLCNRRFRRQHSIDYYIVDFYCASEKLIVELDGQVHLNPTAQVKDEKRDLYLQSMGFTVLRFENKMVFDNLTSVLQEIRDHFNN